MSERYPIIKSGTHHQYYLCDCCTRFVQELSNRGWCGPCENEFTAVGRRVREKLRAMGIPDPPMLTVSSQTPAPE